MKIAGALTLLAGFVVFAGLAAIPPGVTVRGESTSCGPPALRVLVTEASEDSSPLVQRIEQRIIDSCVSQSWERLIVGTVVGGGTALAGLLLLVLTPAPRYRPPTQPPSGSAPQGAPQSSAAPPRPQEPWGKQPHSR